MYAPLVKEQHTMSYKKSQRYRNVFLHSLKHTLNVLVSVLDYYFC